MKKYVPVVFENKINQIRHHLHQADCVLRKWKCENPAFEDILESTGVMFAHEGYEESLEFLEDHIADYEPIEDLMTQTDMLNDKYEAQDKQS